MQLIFFIAWRYFLAKKSESFISVISLISLCGITIGVASLIVVMSVMNGFHIEFSKNVIGLNGEISIRTAAKTGHIENYEYISKELAENKEVNHFSPVIFGGAFAIGSQNNTGVVIKSMNFESLKQKGEILSNISQGTFEDYHGTNVVAIGGSLALNLGARVGSKIKLVTSNFIPTAFGIMPRAKDFTIVAIFNSGLWEYDSATVLMPLDAGKLFLGVQGPNLIEVHLHDRKNTKDMVSILTQKFISEPIYINSWQENHKQFLKALEVERVAMFVILSLIILVAAFNILSSLFMMVKDKTKDIAILKTMGAQNKTIMMIFIVNGMIVGALGTFIGVTFGALLSQNIDNIRKFLEKLSDSKIFDPAIYFLYNLPSNLETKHVTMIAFMSLFLSFIATIYPALRASRLNPVETIRYE